MDTLVYTSAQWRSTSLLNKIIQAGVLCAEIENDYKVKLKIGNGKDRWVDLPYIPELSGYYTKEEIDSFNVVINNKISELEANKHTHDNKEILDKITKEFTIEDKEKLDSITPYDDKEVNKRLTNLEKDAHTHKNKSLLDQTTAVFTTEYEYIITHMETYDVFVGATATKPGTEGLVPAPKAGDNEKFLRGDGNWVTVESGGTYVLPPATRSTLGGVKVGNNINVDANGVISVTFPPIPEPPEPYVLPIASASTLGGIKVGDGLSIDGTGTLSATGIETIPPATTTTIGGVIVGDGISVENDGTISVQEYIAGDGISFTSSSERYMKCTDIYNTRGDQYINTGIITNSSTVRIEFRCRYDDTDGTTRNYLISCNNGSSSYKRFGLGYGIGNVDGTCEYICYFNSNGGYFYYTDDLSTLIPGTIFDQSIQWSSNRRIVATGHLSFTDGGNPDSYRYESTNEITLFGDVSYKSLIIWHLYSCKIYKDDTLVSDLVPCVRESDNKPGLYDTIRNIFLSQVDGNNFNHGELTGEIIGGNVPMNINNTGVLSVTQDSQNLNKIIVEYADDSDEIIIPTYSLPTATSSVLGGVKIGDGVNIDDGVISVTQYQAGVATEIIPGESVDIPNTYQRVEYIQSDTTQYIDTGYTQRSGSCFRIEVCPLQDPNLQSTQQVIFGNYVTTHNTQSYQVCWYMNDLNIYQFTFGISNTIYPSYTYFTGYYDQDIVAHVYNDTIEIYDSNDENLLIKKTIDRSIGDGANTIAIFCKHVDDHYDSKSKIKLRRFSIYSQLNSQNEFDDQYLVMDMYPVVRISDNVAGLYDVITETFFSSPVGNDFIVGPDLYPDTRINVKYNDGLDVNSNNELINTGVLDVSLNESDNTILDVEFADETKHIQLPSDALFTDTWEPLTGATSSENGTVGYINETPPSDGYNTKYFRADGTWAVPPGTYVHPSYTRSDTTTTPAQLAHAGTFTAITSVTSTNGHVTAVNTATYKLPAQYTHPTYTAKTTEALYTIKVDTLGHVSTANAATSDTITNLVSQAGVSTLINKLSTGSSTPKDADYYISQYANGGTTTTTYHRRPMSALWTYVKGKADSVYSALGHTHNYAGSSSAGGAATSANKLNTDAGGVIKPVYFSNGVPVDCNAPASGAWWNTVSPVNSSGVLEIGRYIDFHCTSASTNNYDVRLDAGASNKSLIVQCTNTTSGPWLTVQGVLPKLKFIQTTSGYEYNKDSCGITAYTGGTTDTGLNLVMQSGGNTIIGSGEIAHTFMNSLNNGDRSDIIKYPYRWRDYGECAILASDENAYIWTNGASWDSTKKYFLNLHCFVFNANGNFALPVGGGLYYQYGTRDANTGMVNTVVQSGLLSAATTPQTWTLPNATGTIALTSNIPATYAGSTTAGGSATTVTITNTENTTEVSKAIPFHDDSTGGPYSLLTNDGLGYRTLNGTASALGISRIVIGNATATGTAGNKYGVVRIYSRQTYYADIRTSSSYNGNRTFTLPNKNGTVAVTGAGTWQNVSSVTDSSVINTYDIKYRKGDASAVEIRGSIKFDTLQASYSLTTLPSEYRPDIDRVFPIMDPDSGGYKGRLRITSAGVVTLQFTAPNVLSTSVTYYFSGMFTV